MDIPTYIVREIDGAFFELLPDGSLCIRGQRAGPVTLPAGTVYALYLFLMTPGTRPALRRLDDERQRKLYEARY
jgi:hypothetical protein